MNPQAVVMPVLQTTLNTTGLIQACNELQLENPTRSADHKGLTGFKHTVAVLDEIQRRPYLTGNLLQLGYMVAAYPDDLQLVLAYTGGMAHLYHEQAPRGVGLTIVSGSVNQWLDSCGRACCPEADLTVRFVFNRIYRHLERLIPRDMFTGERKDNDDGTFLLEYNK